MDPAAILAACGALQKELQSHKEIARANALRDMLANRMTPSDSMMNMRFVLRRIMDGKPDLPEPMRGKVAAILAEIESLSSRPTA